MKTNFTSALPHAPQVSVFCLENRVVNNWQPPRTLSEPSPRVFSAASLARTDFADALAGRIYSEVGFQGSSTMQDWHPMENLELLRRKQLNHLPKAAREEYGHGHDGREAHGARGGRRLRGQDRAGRARGRAGRATAPGRTGARGGLRCLRRRLRVGPRRRARPHRHDGLLPADGGRPVPVWPGRGH